MKKFPKNPIFSIFREKTSQFVSSRELKSDSLHFRRLNIDTKYLSISHPVRSRLKSCDQKTDFIENSKFSKN